MTKILLVGDIHAADRPPSSVNEGYLDDIIDLLNQVADLEVELDADAVVWAGDVFNHKQPGRTSHQTVQRMIEVVQRHRNLYIVVGNHDISNDRLESVLDKQPLGVLLRSGATELNGWHPELPLFGVPWQQRWLHEDVIWDAFEDWRGENETRSTRNCLAVTHAPIFPLDQTPPYEYLDLDDIAEAMEHKGYLYYGHIHEDHGIYEHEGVTFANVGAISRGSLHEYNLSRDIQACLWTEDGFSSIKLNAKPAEEVFKITEAEAKKEESISLDNFLAEVGSSTLDISSTESVSSHIHSLELPERIKKLAVEILEEVS